MVLAYLSLILFWNLGWSEGTPKLNEVPTNEDTSIVIKKGPNPAIDRPDYEIVSGEAEVVGDPGLGLKSAYSSWKTSCENWKKEFKEMNQENQILTLGCNSPNLIQNNGFQSYQSKATYKMKVPMKYGQKK